METVENTAPATPPARSRFFPWMVLAGVALLIVSAVGANHALNSGSGTTPAPSPGNASELTEMEKAKIRSVSFGYVDTEEGTVNLYPVQPGRVVEVLHSEGDLVDKGTVLFKMDDRLAREDLLAAETDLAASKLKVETAQGEVKKHEKHLTSLETAILAKEAEISSHQASIEKLQRLVSKNLAPSEDLVQVQKKIESLNLELQSKRDELDGAKAVDTSKLIELAKKEVAGKEIQLKKATLALDECNVKAPDRGRVLRLFVRPGELLGSNPRLPAVQFIAEKPRIVRAEITQDYATRLREGQMATIQDDSRRGDSWKARVVRVGDWYAHRRSISFEPMQLNDVRTLEAVLEFTEPAPSLKIGQRMLVILHE